MISPVLVNWTLRLAHRFLRSLRRSRLLGILVALVAFLVANVVVGVPQADATLTSAQTRLVAGFYSIGDSNAAKRTENALDATLFSANTEAVLTTGLSEYGGSMSPSQVSLVQLAALIDSPADRSLLARGMAGEKFTQAQKTTLTRLVTAVVDNAGLKALVSQGRQLLRHPVALAGDVTAAEKAASHTPATIPSTGAKAMDRLLGSVLDTDRGSAVTSVSKRTTPLLRGAVLDTYVQTLSPLQAASFMPDGAGSDAADVRSPRIPAAATQFPSPVPPSAPATAPQQAYGQALATASSYLSQQLSEVLADFWLKTATGATFTDNLSVALLEAQGWSRAAAVDAVEQFGTRLVGSVGADGIPTGVLTIFGEASFSETAALLSGASIELAGAFLGGIEAGAELTNAGFGIYYASHPLSLQIGPGANTQMTAGQPTTFVANGFGVDGKPYGPEPAAVIQMVPHGGPCPGGVCTTTVAGADAVTATMGDAMTSIPVTVLPGPLATLTLTPPTATIPVNTDTTFALAGADQYGNALDLPADTALLISSDGWCVGDTCGANTPGVYTVTAISGSASSSATLTVVDGPASITVTPTSGTWVAGTEHDFVVDTYDSAGNYLATVSGSSVQLSVTLNSTGAIDGSCNTLGCTANSPGQHTVTATYEVPDTGQTLTSSTTMTVTGPLDHLVLSPAGGSITPGGSVTYTVEGFDAANDDLGPVTDATLSISPDGSCTAYTCTASTAGAHTVTATDGTAQGTATLTVITSYAAPCVFSDAGPPDCQSTDPLVTDEATTQGASGCTFSDNIDWGDGSPVQTVDFTGSGPLETFPIAEYTYSTPGTYSITASAPVGISGPCEGGVGSGDNYQFTLLSSGGSD
jgi:hypothetical protein